MGGEPYFGQKILFQSYRQPQVLRCLDKRDSTVYLTHKLVQRGRMISFYLFIVSFDPDGPLIIQINTQRTITCSYTKGSINSWFVILRNSIEFGAGALQGTVTRFGITGIFMSPSLQLIVNTSNTSIAGLRCVGVVIDSMANIRGNESGANINLTIYGK